MDTQQKVTTRTWWLRRQMEIVLIRYQDPQRKWQQLPMASMQFAHQSLVTRRRQATC